MEKEKRMTFRDFVDKCNFDAQDDRDIFRGSVYKDMEFEYETTWEDFDNVKYASPIFKFKNGDRVVVDKYGELTVL